MLKRLFLILAAGVLLSGCFVAPIALIGPAASGFSTASIIQSGVTTGANYMVKTLLTTEKPEKIELAHFFINNLLPFCTHFRQTKNFLEK